MSSEKDFDKAVELLGPHVSENVTKFTPKDLTVPFLFRLDANVPKNFVPRMPASAAQSENNTVPRVVTATTMFGCMSGHAGMVAFLWDRAGSETPDNHYKISAFTFEFGLFPNKKLVYDAEDNKEAWLITYDKESLSYRPVPIGEMFFHKLSMTVMGKSKVDTRVAEFLAHITLEEGMPLCEGIHLKKGFYYIKANMTKYALSSKTGIKRATIKDKEIFTVTPISASVFKNFRDISVGTK